MEKQKKKIEFSMCASDLIKDIRTTKWLLFYSSICAFFWSFSLNKISRLRL